jgi:hypothetical protein
MGQIFTLQPSVIQTMEFALNDLILYLGKDCRVYYPPKITPCNNCVRDTIGNKSRNIYLHGGPMPFQMNTLCPVCGGAGSTTAEETFEVIHVIVHWNTKKYMNIKLDNVRLAQGVIKIKGHIVDLPKIQAMSYFVPHTDIDAYGHYKFRLAAEPVSQGNIVQGKFFTALMDRIPG